MIVVRSRRSRCSRAPGAVLCVLVALLCGCHSNDLTLPGTPVVTMGSGNGNSDPDFAAYIVAVDDITLTRNDGTLVEPLATPETVDLAKVTSLSELVEGPAVPSGTYLSATLTLDYTSASIWINSGGQAVPVTALDPSGDVMTTASLTITFDPANPLVINISQSVRMNVDIDLAASNTINTSASTVTVQPFVVISPAPVDATVMRARGLYVTEQTVPSGFIMNIRPFYDLVSALGALTVNTNAQTYYNLNGVTYTGAAGLAAVATLMESTTLAVYGTLDNLSGITPTFNATAVYGGTSLESELAEYVTGTVSERTGDTLVVRGATLLDPLGTVTEYPYLYVTVDDTTIVSQDGVAASGLSINSISVGQDINVSGQATLNASNLVILQASGAQVRLASTRLWGTLNSSTANTASLDMLSLDNWPPAGFDFSGTGATAADPAAYQVNSGLLSESAVPAGTLLAVDGFVTPFGSAPPDFSATAITAGSSTPQTLVVEWTNGGALAPFSQATDAGLIVNLANGDLGTTHYIRTGPATLDLTTLPASPTITTTGATASELELAIGSETVTTTGISVFNSMAPFINKVYATLGSSNSTNKIYRLVAYGQYNSTTNTFVATRIHVALEETTTT
jgi:hypothetical protein